jgi:LPXTG-motif cell wall-anchored protein
MKWFVLAGLVMIALWLLSRRKKRNSFALIDDAKPWFELVGLDFSKAMFNVHQGAPVRTNGAIPIVGLAPNSNGDLQGFVIEVAPGSGVVLGEFISRRASMQDKVVAQTLKLQRSPVALFDTLVSMD